MLRACRSVLRPGGVMAFTTIVSAPDLTSAQRRRAAGAGPAEVVVRTGYRSLLRTAGFADVDGDDVTSRYRSTLAAWHEATRRRYDEVSSLVGADEIAARQQRRRAAMAAVDAGLLQRWMYVARRPTRRRPGRPRGSAAT